MFVCLSMQSFAMQIAMLAHCFASNEMHWLHFLLPFIKQYISMQLAIFFSTYCVWFKSFTKAQVTVYMLIW